MFKNIISLASIALALIGGSYADDRDVYRTTAQGTGVQASVASSSVGFNARFFDYPAGDLIRFNDNNWVADSYSAGQPRTTTNSVTVPSFSFQHGSGGKSIYNMYNINMWNVVVELKGYFKAPETGLYTVTINEANDGAWIWLGAGAFDACSQESLENTYDQLLLGVRCDGAYSSFVYLEEGNLYPMRTTYINIYFGAQFQFEVITPSGDIITDFSDTIINFDINQIESCTSAVYGDNSNKQAVVGSAASASGTGLSTTTVTNTFAATTTMVTVVTTNGVTQTTSVVVEQVSADAKALPNPDKAGATATITGRTLDNAYGCSINTAAATAWPGFHASVYNYDGCFGFLESTYYANGYTTESLMGTGANITAPNFSVKAWLGNTDTIYGAHLDSWKGYVAQLTGYIKAQESGLYQFAIDYSDDGSMVWIGTNDAFACCQPDSIPYDSADGALFFAKDQEARNGYVHLDAGSYYPIRVVLVNWYGDSVMQMSMITPSGDYIKDDWSDFIVSFPELETGSCSA